MHPLAPYALIYPMLGMQLAAVQTFWGLALCAWSPGTLREEK